MKRLVLVVAVAAGLGACGGKTHADGAGRGGKSDGIATPLAPRRSFSMRANGSSGPP
ncbi:MAG: hypothetical protein JW940_39375 [Polyangiaceae bacterium]|nr:hypothetical protein [Polyangiaceae bacterium]